MSSLVIAGDTSGTITLQAPAVSGSSVLTLPANTDTVAVQSQAVRQVISNTVTAVATGTTVLPHDDTIPQNTEGDQYMSLSITPKSATSKLIIDVTWNGSYSINSQVTAALFQDTTANALAAVSSEVITGNQTMLNLKIQYVMTSNTTSATTFKVRAGGTGIGSTTTFNGRNGARIMGGVMTSSIIITEIGG